MLQTFIPFQIKVTYYYYFRLLKDIAGPAKFFLSAKIVLLSMGLDSGPWSLMLYHTLYFAFKHY